MAEPQADKGHRPLSSFLAKLFWGFLGESQENPGALHSGSRESKRFMESGGALGGHWEPACPLLEGLWWGEGQASPGPLWPGGGPPQLLAHTAVGPEFGELSLSCLSHPTAPSTDGPSQEQSLSWEPVEADPTLLLRMGWALGRSVRAHGGSAKGAAAACGPVLPPECSRGGSCLRSSWV